MARTLDQPSLYEADYALWLQEQVAHLRAGRLFALDVENVAEELESLMKSERRELRSRLEVLILHLLKWDHQPDQRSIVGDRAWPSSALGSTTCGGDTPPLRPSLDQVADRADSHPQAAGR